MKADGESGMHGNLTSVGENCKQATIKGKMARMGRGRGRGGRGRQSHQNRADQPTSMPASQRHGRRSMRTAVQEAARAYQEGTDEEIC